MKQEEEVEEEVNLIRHGYLDVTASPSLHCKCSSHFFHAVLGLYSIHLYTSVESNKLQQMGKLRLITQSREGFCKFSLISKASEILSQLWKSVSSLPLQKQCLKIEIQLDVKYSLTVLSFPSKAQQNYINDGKKV